ncbi:50S ribosomal protein L30 [Candidatus Woesearchaeota archaeon]|jgi:large subunit ribosomal protein L30|nr:50S ribosomal protein L30 [Candidatus Woesearchaeota archaeon]MBT4387735.1 50S ribosomal protein L30 [Candidatus Woesearchaeota archaeon]MBT4595554.1 50S ribosomal protein L30 [Candidatus Woesearchaeota archaeon]MBT5740963.1 50S ribosomal protein L30 [Candidatus Woesearchaeota archaeon]MBT6505780.1 50S ribosomal protein L30 [Candidatus Woesearchaeota archaeon]
MKIALIRIRGQTGIRKDIKDTLTMLNLHKNNYCSIIELSDSNKNMVKKVENFITWGEIDTETEKLLSEKKLEKDGRDPSKNKKYFRLNPPVGGFERKGIKKHFTIGGALGYRNNKINDLIKKMI